MFGGEWLLASEWLVASPLQIEGALLVFVMLHYQAFCLLILMLYLDCLLFIPIAMKALAESLL